MPSDAKCLKKASHLNAPQLQLLLQAAMRLLLQPVSRQALRLQLTPEDVDPTCADQSSSHQLPISQFNDQAVSIMSIAPIRNMSGSHLISVAHLPNSLKVPGSIVTSGCKVLSSSTSCDCF